MFSIYRRTKGRLIAKIIFPALIAAIIFSLLLFTFFPKHTASSQDTDFDGCTDQQEIFVNPALGGMRNPNNFWDFFDVPNGNNQRDQVVSIGDILLVITRFGTNDNGGTALINRNSDPLSPPPASGYHPAFDRSTLGPNPWNLGPADGSISISDVVSVVNQFGHSCVWDDNWVQNQSQLTSDMTAPATPELTGTPMYEVLCYESQAAMDEDAADGELYPPCTVEDIAKRTAQFMQTTQALGQEVSITAQQAQDKVAAALKGPILAATLPPEANEPPGPLLGITDDSTPTPSPSPTP